MRPPAQGSTRASEPGAPGASVSTPGIRDGSDERSGGGGRAELERVGLELVRELVAELHPAGQAATHVTLSSQLDRELGLDSLARMELLGRLERAFRVRIPEREVLRAHTPSELVALVARAAPSMASAGAAALDAGAARTQAGRVQAPPDRVQDLAAVLRWHAAEHGSRVHVYLVDEAGDEHPLTYSELLRESARRATGLLAQGVAPGEKVAIMLPTGLDYLATFLGLACIGAVPVPIYPPTRPSQIEEHLQRHAAILRNAECVLLVSVPEALPVAKLLRLSVPCLRRVCVPAQVVASTAALAAPQCSPDDTAFLQYTSGSTGQPKGVVLSHRNLLENIRAMGRAAHVGDGDVLVSWLPLYHDMGLIGGWLTGLYFGFPVVLMSPLSFLARPAQWLWAIHRHRGTISASPNFGYDLCVKKIEDAEIEGLDLSSWRFALNGAEPVSPRTLEEFCQRFAAFGFARGALSPVYGLAECAVGVAFPPMGRGPLIDRIDREVFASSGRAVPVAPDVADALEFVACGRPLPGHQVRVVDGTGREAPDRHEGRLQFAGPSVTSGYYHNPEATRRLFDGEWAESGDRAYVAGGDVYLTGRIKDIIIRAGHNLYPHELEDAVGSLDGVRRGCVAVFASTDARRGTERIVVMAETRIDDDDGRRGLESAIRALATDVAGTPPDEVVLVPPHTVLKTSSGKIRRAASREAFEQGRLGARAAWSQLLRLTLASLLPRLRRSATAFAALAFAAHAWAVFALVAVGTWLCVLVLPGARLRWRVARLASKALGALTGARPSVTGLEHLPASGGYVVVANHQSNLDGFALTAALPVELAFVVKAELARSVWTRMPLDRIGVEYVERFDPEQSLSAAGRLQEAARAGRPLVFFPEGTHARMPGLLPFHLGAFQVAAQAALPVVPVVVRGTRSILRPDTWFPRHGKVQIDVGPAIAPAGSDFAAAAALSRAARAWMMRRGGEPDLE